MSNDRTPLEQGFPHRLIGVLLCVALGLGCATSPTGRTQLLLMDEAQMAQMGQAAFVQMQGEVPRSTDAAKTRYVQCVASSITRILGPADMRDLPATQWQVELFEDESANAFALPGGGIGVHTGLLDVARNADQLATVVGHEIGHVLARHGNARVSSNMAAESLAGLAAAFIGGDDPATQQQVIGLLGMGAQFGILLPYGRGDESEADLIGLRLMARAGFDPRQSVLLWQNMGAASAGQAPPEFMSTHPSHATRITDLQKNMDEALALYRQAQAAGRKPNCR